MIQVGKNFVVSRLAAALLAHAPVCLGAIGLATQAGAEPVLDRALASARLISKNGGCELLKISFNFRVRYASHFPISSGPDLRVMVRAIDPGVAAAEFLSRRESLRPPQSKLAAIKSIEFDLDPAGGPALVIQFGRPVHFDVAEGADFESVVVAISDGRSKAACRPIFPESSATEWAPIVQLEQPWPAESAASSVPPRAKARGTAKLTETDRTAAAAAMDEARAALKKSKPETAMRLLTKVLKLPENEFSAQAQELMGLARQRSGDLAEARAEYEDYLTRYPQGEGAERVRQRLAGVTTAQGGDPPKLRSVDSNWRQTGRSRAPGDGSSTWTLSGSASQFYIRDDSFRVVHDPSIPPDLTNDPDEHRVHQNELLSSLDLIGTWSNAASKWKFRFSGSEEHSFAGDEDEIVSVAALYLEATVRDWDALARVGRQTRNTGGVLGRFDGALFSWQAQPWLGVNLVGGSPAARRSDEPFKDDKYFAGISFDIGRFYEGLDISLFAIEQRYQDIVDREAIGFELRYLTPSLAGFATVDYDLHFGDFNAAVASGTWTMPDKATLHLGAEYRKSPYLSAWTALQGQPFITLYDLLKLHTIDEIDQLAIDRTATYKSATVGYSRALTEHLQVSGDVTVSELSGTIGSGGVEATASSGTEIYYSAQIIGNDMAADGDMYIVGFRFADREDSNLYVLDLNSRYPITPDLRVGPRVRLGYREGDGSDLKEYSVLPSVLVNYFLTRDLNLEIEAGAQWTSTKQNGVEENETELFLTAGFRYDFYADGVVK